MNGALCDEDRALERLTMLVQPISGALALSIAADGARLAHKLSEHGAQVVSADKQAQHIAMHCARFEMTRLPFRAKRLPLIVVCDAARRLADVPRFLSECARVLSPSGKLALLEPLAPAMPAAARYVNAFERLRDPSHVQQFSLADWRAMLRAAELDLTHVETLVTPLRLYCSSHGLHHSADTLLRLRILLQQAPQAVRDFLKPSRCEDGSGDLCFERTQIILIARTR